jgi:hypothetical protein
LNDVSLHQLLVLYTWFPFAALLLFLLLIARFYQRFSGERTYYWLYVLVMALFGAMAVRHAGAGIVIADVFTDLIACFAGVLLLFLTIRLQTIMLARKPERK